MLNNRITKTLDRLKILPNRPILVALLAADLLFIVLNVFYLLPQQYFPLFQQDAFSVSQDRGLAEAYQYVKEFWIALIFFWLVIKHRRIGLLGLGLLFSYLMFDDMIQIHEKLGDVAANLFVHLPLLTLFPNMQPDDFGELLVAGLIGLVILGAISVPYLRSRGETRQVFQTIFLLLIIFLLFAVGLDFINGFFGPRIVREFISLVEDGGEMLVMSVICWYSTSLIGEFCIKIPSRT
jgi:hypothetical protein